MASFLIPLGSGLKVGQTFVQASAETLLGFGIDLAAQEGIDYLAEEYGLNEGTKLLLNIVAGYASGKAIQKLDSKVMNKFVTIESEVVDNMDDIARIGREANIDDSYKSLFGEMSADDAVAYEKFMKNGSTAGFTQKK